MAAIAGVYPACAAPAAIPIDHFRQGLEDGDELALVPAISGGSGQGEPEGADPAQWRFDFCHGAIDPRPLEVRVDDGAALENGRALAPTLGYEVEIVTGSDAVPRTVMPIRPLSSTAAKALLIRLRKIC